MEKKLIVPIKKKIQILYDLIQKSYHQTTDKDVDIPRYYITSK